MKKLASLTMVAVIAAGCRPAAPTRTQAPVAVERTVLTSAMLTERTDVAELVRDMRRVVVNITAVEAVRLPEASKETKASASPRFLTYRHELEGAGFILDSSGLIATNAHLVAGASLVRVQLWDDRELTAQVVGVDAVLDVALLRVSGVADLPAAALGSSAEIEVGEPVIAIGNPFGFKHSVTAGILSARTRIVEAPIDDFLQTDAAINPGNSGGPLFNRRGEVIGMNTAIAMSGQGIGFAVPIDAFERVLPQLLTRGYVERGDLGFELQAIDGPLAKALQVEPSVGALVSAMEVKGPAERAGVKRGDVVLALDGTTVRAPRDLELMIARKAPGSRAELSVRRNGKALSLVTEVGELAPDEILPLPREWPKPKGWGVELAEDRGTVTVRDVAIGSVLDGRLENGDQIIEIDYAPVRTTGDVEGRWNAAGPHLLWIRRDGVPRFVGLDR
jgi:S1-C subfamily serine protease